MYRASGFIWLSLCSLLSDRGELGGSFIGRQCVIIDEDLSLDEWRGRKLRLCSGDGMGVIREDRNIPNCVWHHVSSTTAPSEELNVAYLTRDTYPRYKCPFEWAVLTRPRAQAQKRKSMGNDVRTLFLATAPKTSPSHFGRTPESLREVNASCILYHAHRPTTRMHPLDNVESSLTREGLKIQHINVPIHETATDAHSIGYAHLVLQLGHRRQDSSTLKSKQNGDICTP